MSATLRRWFDDFTADTGEAPTHVVFGAELPWKGDHRWPRRFADVLAGVPVDVVIPWADVPTAALDVEFDAGYGGKESPDLCAWSESWVIVSGEYDGAEWIAWVPRHPTDHKPASVGG